MKNLSFYAFLALVCFTFNFSSCTKTNEPLPFEEGSTELLQSFIIQKNYSGKYTIDFMLNDNAEIDNVKNPYTNTNEIYLYSSNNQSNKKEHHDIYDIDGGQIKLKVTDTYSDLTSNINIIDDDYSAEGDKLKKYSISGNSDGTSYILDFSVKDGVVADYVYNEEEEEHKVKLKYGKSSKQDFSKVFLKEINKPLKIAFVNNKNNTNHITLSRKPNRPAVIIE